jgi:hypothetical protein
MRKPFGEDEPGASHIRPLATSRGLSGFVAVGFPGGPESGDEYWTRVGQTRHFRVALVWVLRGRLTNTEGLGASTPKLPRSGYGLR